MTVDTTTVDTASDCNVADCNVADSESSAKSMEVLQTAYKSLMRQGVDVVEFLNLLMLFRKFFLENVTDAIDADLIDCCELDDGTWVFSINLFEFFTPEECADLNDKWQDVMIDWMYADKLTRRRVLDHVSVHFSYA